MIEVEVKIPVKSLSPVKDLLQKLRGVNEGVHVEVDTYYNHPCRDFMATDEALRVRITDEESHSLTYKGPKLRLETKTRVEMNLQLDNGESIKDMLQRLGFRKAATVTKKREWWKLGNTRVYLDEVDDLGKFVEIEHEVEEMDGIQEAEEEVFRLIELLHLDRSSATTKSYLELVLEKERLRE